MKEFTVLSNTAKIIAILANETDSNNVVISPNEKDDSIDIQFTHRGKQYVHKITTDDVIAQNPELLALGMLIYADIKEFGQWPPPSSQKKLRIPDLTTLRGYTFAQVEHAILCDQGTNPFRDYLYEILHHHNGEETLAELGNRAIGR